MNDIELLKNKLNEYNCFSYKLPSDFEKIIDSIPTFLTKKMKLQLLTHYLTFYISQFRIPINFNSQQIPINSIAFLFSYSGSGKDTTINLLKKMLEPSFELISSRQEELNYERADRLLSYFSKGELDDYLIKIPPNEIGISTPEGLIQSLDTLDNISLGSLNINTNEFISEISNSSLNLFAMMNILAELYDIGRKNSKQLKDKSKENKTLNNIFLNGLFTSSFNITLDSNIRKKILLEFQSRFARRSSITFNNVDNNTEEINDIDSWLEKQIKNKHKYSNYLKEVAEDLKNTTINLLKTDIKSISLSESAFKILLLYQEYGKRESKKYDNLEYSFINLNIQNRYWQALKLSGTLCLLDLRREISKEDMINAINIINLINEDVVVFERELNKLPYEILIDYCRNQVFCEYETKFKIPVHLLKKINILRDIKNVEDLLVFCNSGDREGIYTYNSKEKNIEYSKIENNTNKIYSISIIKLDDRFKNKEDFSKQLYLKFTPFEVPEHKLVDMLKTNLIYSPYKFKNNIRNKENLINYTNLLVFDIDNSEYPIDKFHELLKGNLNHIIATTKDVNNKFKFRLLLPLSSKVSIDEKYFTKLSKIVVKNHLLNIDVDYLPQSQVFYSYKDSEVYFDLDSEYLDIKDYLIMLQSGVKETTLDLRSLNDKEKKSMLKNKFVTFKYAYDSTSGNRHKNLIYVINQAFDLGATYDEIYELIENINNFIDFPLTPEELNKTIIPHLRKKYEKI